MSRSYTVSEVLQQLPVTCEMTFNIIATTLSDSGVNI